MNGLLTPLTGASRRGLLFTVLALLALASSATAKRTEDMLPERWKAWLSDVEWIIADYELEVFESLNTEAERDEFELGFWERRTPPDMKPEETKEEHYRRLKFADEHFHAGVPGRKTDRGRIYITLGPPDTKMRNPGGLRGFALGATASAPEFASEIWNYRHIPGATSTSTEVELFFVDRYDTGLFELSFHKGDANAFRNTSAPSRHDGFPEDPKDKYKTEKHRASETRWDNPFEILNLEQDLFLAPERQRLMIERSRRLAILDGYATSRVSYNRLPVRLVHRFFRTTGDATYVPLNISVPAKALAFEEQGDRYVGLIDFYGKLLDEQGQELASFSSNLEPRLTLLDFEHRDLRRFDYETSLTLPPGIYKLDLVVADRKSANVGTASGRLLVPGYTNSDLSLSSVLLASDIQHKPRMRSTVDLGHVPGLGSTSVKVAMDDPKRGHEPFRFGDYSVTPLAGRPLPPGGELGVYFQVYNPKLDSASRANLSVDVLVGRGSKGPAVARLGQSELVQERLDPEAATVSVGRVGRLVDLEPGNYRVVVRVHDRNGGGRLQKQIPFVIR